jgi:hypothetical protein
MKNILATFKHWLALFYGMSLIVIVVLFFFNYGGRWMRLIAERLPINGN